MGDFLADAIASIQQTRKDTMAETITYSRGSSSVQISATRGRSEFEVIDQNGIQHDLTSQDFICHVSDLVLDGSQKIPVPGDRVETSDGKAFEVMQMTGVPAYRFSDEQKTIYRIHTKVVG